MSVKVSASVKLAKVKEFPKLMVSNDGQLVLFASEGRGVALNCVCAEVGRYYIDWLVLSFKDYEGEVTLKNE